MSSAQINQVPTASAFTPLAVPGCALWLDGADQTSMTLNQSTLTNWRDKSGNGYMALSFSNAVSPPNWVAGVQNGATDQPTKMAAPSKCWLRLRP